MLKSSDIRQALADLIKNKAGLPLKVFFNQVADAGENYAWVRLRPSHKNLGYGYLDRKIRVDIQIVLAPVTGIVRHTDLYDMVDALDAATCDPLKITDRFITVYDADFLIFDNILTYSFVLGFTDCTEDLPVTEEPTFARELYADFKDTKLESKDED